MRTHVGREAPAAPAGAEALDGVGGDELIGYAEIAAMMRVKVTTVYNYAVWHDYFPEAATPAGQRPPRFRKADVDAYIARRSAQAVGAPGRPVKTLDVGERVSREQGARASVNIRARLAAGDAPRHQEIVDALGISKPALKARLRRETRWKVTELERIAALLGATVDELTRESDA